MKLTDSAQRIFARHSPIAEENGKCCGTCGRPWPCDVERLAQDLRGTQTLVERAGWHLGPPKALREARRRPVYRVG